MALERETKKLHAEVTVLQEELERKSRQASSQLDGDMKSLQRDLTDKTKVCVCLSHQCLFFFSWLAHHYVCD